MVPVGPVGSDSTVACIQGGLPRFSEGMGVPGVIGGNTGLGHLSIHHGIGTDRAPAQSTSDVHGSRKPSTGSQAL